MAKGYFNQSEREQYIKVMCLVGELHDLAAMDLEAEERKNLKAAHTYLSKGLNRILDRLDSKFASQINRTILASEFMMLPKERAKIERDEWQKVKGEDQCVVSLPALESLAEKAIHWCCECQEMDKQSCLLRDVYNQLEIPVYDAKQECPYEVVV